MMAGVGLGIDELHRAAPIISGFLLGYTAVLPLIGRLSDLLARQTVLLCCLVVFVIGSAVTAVSVELPVLVGGRVLQGVGGGGLVPATLALVADLWPPDRRGPALGVVGAVQEVGSVLGPVLGAAVLVVADWRAIFWLNVILGITIAGVLMLSAGRAARPRLRLLPTVLGMSTLGAGMLTLVAPSRLANDVILGIPFVPFAGTSRLATPLGVFTIVLFLVSVASLSRRSTSSAARVATAAPGPFLGTLRRVDLPGALCIAVALGSLVLTFSSADPEREVVGPWGWALLPLGLAAVAAYFWRHRTAVDPLVPRGLMATQATGRPTQLIPALLVSLLAGVALVAVVVDLPFLARLTVTGSQTTAALLLVRFLLAVPLGALAGGWLLARRGPAAVAAAGLLLTGIGLTIMSSWGAGSLQSWTATPVLAMAGLGLGLAIAPVNAAALADAPDNTHGVISALVVSPGWSGWSWGWHF